MLRITPVHVWMAWIGSTLFKLTLATRPTRRHWVTAAPALVVSLASVLFLFTTACDATERQPIEGVMVFMFVLAGLPLVRRWAPHFDFTLCDVAAALAPVIMAAILIGSALTAHATVCRDWTAGLGGGTLAVGIAGLATGPLLHGSQGVRRGYLGRVESGLYTPSAKNQ